MAKVIILGSSNAVPSKDHENTHLVIIGKERTILVDCVSNPIVRLEQAGVDFNDLTDIVITHFHPDHVSGVPLLLMDMWLMGRTKPINIYGLHYTMDRLEDLMGYYGWDEWPNFFSVGFYRLPEAEMAYVLDCDEFKIQSSPVHHMIPTIACGWSAKTPAKFLRTLVTLNRVNKPFAWQGAWIFLSTKPAARLMDIPLPSRPAKSRPRRKSASCT